MLLGAVPEAADGVLKRSSKGFPPEVTEFRVREREDGEDGGEGVEGEIRGKEGFVGVK